MKYRRIWFVMLGIIAVGVLVTTCNSFILSRQSARVAADQELAMEETVSLTDMEEGVNSDTLAEETIAAAQAGPTSGSTPATSPLTDDAAKTDGAVEGGSESQEVIEKAEVLSPLETTADITFDEDAPKGPGIDAARNYAIISDRESGPDYQARLDELELQIQKMRSTETEATTYSMKTAAENELKLWDSELNNIYNDILTHLDEDQTQELVAAEREWMKERDARAVEAARRSAGGTLEGLEYTASLAESTRARAYELADMYAMVAE